MTFPNTSSRLLSAGRILAITAMSVLLFGKMLHLSQECGDCCSAEHSHIEAQDASAGKSSCPFGCEHHSSQTTPDSNGPECPEQNSEHDEHDCAVCSVLAQAPQNVAVVGLPDEFPIVVETISYSSVSAKTVAFLAILPRGPPTAS